MADGDQGFVESSGEGQVLLNNFWNKTMDEVERASSKDFKNQELPLARIKKIMKLDEDVKMISQEAPMLFAKAAEIFISELGLRAWVQTEESKRRTLQRNDIATAISKFDQFDFLIDIVPRDIETTKSTKRETATDSGAGVQFLYQNQQLGGQVIQLGSNNQLPAGAQVIQLQTAPGQGQQSVQISAHQLQALFGGQLATTQTAQPATQQSQTQQQTVAGQPIVIQAVAQQNQTQQQPQVQFVTQTADGQYAVASEQQQSNIN